MLTARQYQMSLKHYGGYYSGSVDGISGSKTKAAIRSFQSEHGLTADGIYGSKTDAKIQERIKILIKQLNKKGGYKLKVSGYVTSTVASYIKKYQKKSKLTADGIAGVKTLKSLGMKVPSTSSSKAKVDWTKVKYFKKSEFKCGCRGRYCDGYPVEMNPKVIAMLETMREYYDKSITITSGMRCKGYNNSLVGSIPTSEHMKGSAVDIYIPGQTTTRAGRAAVKRYAYKLGAAYCYSDTPNMGNAVHINF